MIRIRPARLEELGLLRKIAIETSVATFAAFNTRENMDSFLAAYDHAQLEKEWQEAGSVYYLAWDQDQAVGFGRLRLNNEVENYLGKNTIELQRLYVHPDHQGKSIGSQLMKQVLEYASKENNEWIWLGVWERNFKAQEFYVKWGFERFGEHVFQMGDDPQTDWLLKLRVKSEQRKVKSPSGP